MFRRVSGLCCALALLATTAAVMPPGAEAEASDSATIAYVSNSSFASGNDRGPVDALRDQGYNVVLVADENMAAVATDAEVDLVVISTSTNPALFAEVLTESRIPIVTWDPAVADEMGLTAGARDAGAQRQKRWIRIKDPEHPIAEGLTGRAFIFTQNVTTTYGSPSADAEIVAVNPSGQPTLFTYRAGDELVDQTTAAGCRILAPFTWISMSRLSSIGKSLLGTIVEHGLTCGPRVVIDDDLDGFSPPDDCNDSDPAINPDAEDIPDDGIDQDCSGSDRRTPVQGDIENVVVIMTDDMAYTDYAHMPKTQQLLGEEGVTFEKFYQNTPVCCPARATLLTGQRSLHHDVNTNKPADGEGYEALDHTNTMATWFEADGYDTIHIGKYLNGYGYYSLDPEIRDNLEIPPGWTNFQTLIGNVKYFDYLMNDNGVEVSFGARPEDYQTDVLAARAADAIQESVAVDNPFFLWVTTFAPHTWGQGFPPLPAPRHQSLYDDVEPPRDPSFNEADLRDKPGYVRATKKLTPSAIRDLDDHWENQIESLQAVDDLVETVYNTLEDQGVLDRTLIVFLSDNGYLLGQHRLVGKIRPYEESIHVPLVMRGGPFIGGQTVDHVVSSTDLAPTILAQTSVEPGRLMDGLDLSDVLVAPERYDNRAIIIEMVEGPGYDAVRTEDWMWIEYYGTGRELYDMIADPYQLASQHRTGGSYAAVRQELSQLLAELRTCAGDECIRYANP